MTNHQPPKWATRFVEWYCKPELAEDLLGDLNEYFERNTVRVGARRARMIYVIDAVKFCRTYTVRKPKFVDILINWIMIGSYIKTSGRNVMRNKLFSAINIVGLAVSMSVGLLLVAFIHDLKRYDKFNEKGDRIYRITSLPSFNGEQSSKFASTSIRAGRLIQEKISAIEETAIITTGFKGDAKIGDNVVPVDGLYTEPAIFRIFTFPLLKGDPSKALKDPNSIVLTETSAKKLFGNEEAFGKSILFDSVEYQVTGVMKDIPFHSHIHFESLVSHVTRDRMAERDKYRENWGTMWNSYVYMLMPEGADVNSIQAQLDAISAEENKTSERIQIKLSLLPLFDIMVGEDLSNNPGPVMLKIVLWIVSGLALIVILSACFNYTNLSIARSMRRFKEIGLRKVIGARKGQVRQQFLVEAVIVSLSALVLSYGMFLLLRPQFIGMAPELGKMVRLEVTPVLVLLFVLFAVGVGILAGSLPAVFLSKVSIISALKDTTSLKVFRRVNARKILVVVQYTLTLMFITTTIIGYKQYKSFLAFDLGFTTSNVVNVRMADNKQAVFMNEVKSIPEVESVSRSRMITSTGHYWGGHMKYAHAKDSTMVWYNAVDENYMPLHNHKLIAGHNFIARPKTKKEVSEIIVNEKVLKQFGIGNGDIQKALGEEVTLDNKKLKIIGVMKDFHYGKVDSPIEPVVFTYLTPDEAGGFVNLRINTNDPMMTMAKIENVWSSYDRVHKFDARFYDDQIQDAYSEFAGMLKVIGFLSFLAVTIASMGLFGMVVFTTETRLKEISIRKVMGASSGSLIILLGRGFMLLLTISALVALPLTYFLFENVFLTTFPFHDPVGATEVFLGALIVMLLAFIMIGSQTMKAARNNPAEVLKGE